MKYRFYRFKYNLKERIFIISFSLIFIALTFFIIVKSVEKPSFYVIKSYESGNLYVILLNKNISTKLIIERIDLIKIEYPYFKPKFYCLNYDFIYNKSGYEIGKCFSTIYETVYGKEVYELPSKDLVDFLKNRIIIKNKFSFPLNLEIFVDLQSLKFKNVYRNNTLIFSNVEEFFDSQIILPYGVLEYKFE
jgi:hypothetical protein